MTTKKDMEIIKNVIMPLLEEEKSLRDQLLSLPKEHFTVINGIEKPYSKEAKELTQKSNECQQKLWEIGDRMQKEIEAKRFKKIESSQQAIMDDAYAQTDEIIEYMLKAIKLGEPDVQNPSDILEQIKPLIRIWDSETIRNIRRSGGEATKLDAQQIIKLIQGHLYRHLNTLGEQDREDLEKYIRQAVAEAVNEHPEIEDGKYWIVTKDSIFSTIGALAVKKNKLNKGTKKTYLKIGNVKYSFDKSSYAEIKKHIGVNAVNLYIMTNHEFTLNPNDRNEVSFPTIPFLELCGKGDSIKNDKTLATEIERIRYGELASLRSMAISLDAKDRDNFPDLTDQNLYSRTRINKDRIIVTFTPEYAAYLRTVKTKGYIPTDILRGSGNELNALAIKFKLWDNATQYNNVLSGQSNIISVRSLLKETSLPTIEDLGSYKSRWRERIRERFEIALGKAFESDLFTGWTYCKAQSKKLTPQERRDADRNYYSWEGLYISYDLKDQAFKARLIENAEKNKEKRIEAAERKKQREIIATAKALEKLEKN